MFGFRLRGPRIPLVLRSESAMIAVLMALLPVTAPAQERASLSVLSVPSVQALAHHAVSEVPRASHQSLSTWSRGQRPTAWRPHPSSARPLLVDDESPHRFRGALIGSTIGVGLGAGALLILSGVDWDERYNRAPYGDDGELRARGAAAIAILGSAPLGAVIGADLAEAETISEALVAAGMGEFIFGLTGVVMGAGTASIVGADEHGQSVGGLVGLGVGAALGSALGAVVAAQEQSAALSVRDGTWRVGLPPVSVHPVLGDRPSAVVHVPLVAAQF